MFSSLTLLLSALACLASSTPQKTSYVPADNQSIEPYAYQYGVADEVSKANFHKSETQDANVSDAPL